MNTTELVRALEGNKCTRNWFKGCYAADRLPKRFKKPALFIANSQKAQYSGEHWISLYVALNGDVEFFDSFGRAPYITDHIDFIKKHCTKSCVYSSIPIQHLFSSKCGQFSAAFLLFKSRGVSMRTFLKLFSHKNPMLNDKIIEEIFNVNFIPSKFNKKSKFKIDCNQIG